MSDTEEQKYVFSNKCLFCGKTSEEVTCLIVHTSKPEVTICESCIMICHNMLFEKLNSSIDDLTEKVNKLTAVMGGKNE